MWKAGFAEKKVVIDIAAARGHLSKLPPFSLSTSFCKNSKLLRWKRFCSHAADQTMLHNICNLSWRLENTYLTNILNYKYFCKFHGFWRGIAELGEFESNPMRGGRPLSIYWLATKLLQWDQTQNWKTEHSNICLCLHFKYF